MYPADRARFRDEIDKLSRRATKTPLTSLLASIKSATRLIACGASQDMAQRISGRSKGYAVTKQPGTVAVQVGRKNWPGLGGARRGGGLACWPAFSLVRGSFS